MRNNFDSYLLQHHANVLHSLDAFKSWVANHGLISVPNQICLTGQGKAVRAQTLLTEVGFKMQIESCCQLTEHPARDFCL